MAGFSCEDLNESGTEARNNEMKHTRFRIGLDITTIGKKSLSLDKS